MQQKEVDCCSTHQQLSHDSTERERERERAREFLDLDWDFAAMDHAQGWSWAARKHPSESFKILCNCTRWACIIFSMNSAWLLAASGAICLDCSTFNSLKTGDHQLKLDGRCIQLATSFLQCRNISKTQICLQNSSWTTHSFPWGGSFVSSVARSEITSSDCWSSSNFSYDSSALELCCRIT